MVRFSDAHMVVNNSDLHLVIRPVLRPPFKNRSEIHIWQRRENRLYLCTIISGIWIANHLNIDEVKVHYSDISTIQILTIMANKVVLIYYRLFKNPGIKPMQIIELDIARGQIF